MTAAAPAPIPPTLAQFKAYQAAYDYFNAVLFSGELRPCLLVFRDGRPVKNGVVLGHFGPLRWQDAGGELTHEISLNPQVLTRPLADTMGTLVHEMCHQWQQDHGEPPRKGYHDREWAAKMVAVGLVPSDTGQPGGRTTGQRMTHYVAAGGVFEQAMQAMPADVRLPWTTGDLLLKKKPAERKKNKLKYTCPGCGANVWGKAELRVLCGECDETYVQQEQPDGD